MTLRLPIGKLDRRDQSMHGLHEEWFLSEAYPCFSWLLRPTIPIIRGISYDIQIGKNLPIIGKIGHKNRFKYISGNRRNLETLAGVLGMNIAYYNRYRR